MYKLLVVRYDNSLGGYPGAAIKRIVLEKKNIEPLKVLKERTGDLCK